MASSPRRQLGIVVGAITLITSADGFFTGPGVSSSASRGWHHHRNRMMRSKGATVMGSAAAKTSVLFDFDGTLGDTETPAMEVAFWELAPYLPSLIGSGGLDDQSLDSIKNAFIQDNAGRAFEFMVEDTDEERKKLGLPPIETQRGVPPSDPKLAKAIDEARKRFGLAPLDKVDDMDILTQQKEETNQALAVCTVPNPGVEDVCNGLTQAGIPFCIATTSGKPRVPISVKAAGLETFFPPTNIHSGESDFDPPRFKPDPSVYLLAAETEGCAPTCCVAVEDSASGVGSAANAKIGFIIGYVGGTHIPEAKKDSHAKMLMAGERSDDGRGAEIVVEEFANILPLAKAYSNVIKEGRATGAAAVKKALTPEVVKSLTGKVWLPTAVSA